jgi:hypothetical protein
LLVGLAALEIAFLVDPTPAAASGRADGEISILQVHASPQLDGICDTSREYGAARRLSFAQDTAYLVHDGDALWICFDDLPDTLTNATALVRLDFDLGRLNPIQPDDLVLEVTHTGSTRTLAGNGVGGLVVTGAGEGRWDARYTEQRTQRSAEFRLDIDWIGGVGRLVGLSLGSETSQRRDIWPAGAVPSSPTTWGRVILEGDGQQRTFSGQITYQARDGSVHPAPNVGVTLIGNNRAGREVRVALAQTDAQGNYTLTSTDGYVTHRVELDTRTLPRGYQSLTAGLSSAGTPLDSRTIGFVDFPSGLYTDNDFVLSDIIDYADDLDYAQRGPEGPYLLIVTTGWIAEQSLGLQEFVKFKTQLGFAVEVVTVEEIEQSYSAIVGRHNKIRMLEQQKRSLYGNRFQYVMLIGGTYQIPYVKLDIMANEPPNECDHGDLFDYSFAWKYSDWYYADLVSNFDSNGNGCYADGIWGKDHKPGYTPDTGILFAPTVAVGRIPFSNPWTVSQVLENSIKMEKRGFRSAALLAMSSVALEGYTSLQFFWGYTPCENMWSKCVPVAADKNYDGAVLGEAISSYLAPHGFKLETLYETYGAEAGGAKIASSHPLGSGSGNDVVAKRINMFGPGYVNLAGHGNGYGVFRTFWEKDANDTGLYEYATDYTDEYGQSGLLTGNFLPLIDTYSSSLYFLNACSTSDPIHNNNFVQKLLAGGQAAAVFAAPSIVTTGSWYEPQDGLISTTNYYVTRAALHENLRFGDALWRVLGERINAGSRGTGEIAMAYYGDPTLSYWGHPGAHSTRAAWPMLRHDPYGQSWTHHSGPGTPKELWSWNAQFAPAPVSLPPSPVIDQNGRIYIGRGANLDVLSIDGTLLERMPLAAKAFGTPALAADDETVIIYVVDVAGTLYSFARYKNSESHFEAWRLELGGVPQTSPIVGSDGFISIAVKANNGQARLALVRPGGVKFGSNGLIFSQVPLQGDAIGATAVHPDRTIYATTTGGQLARYNPFSNPPIVPDPTTATPFSTPPLLAKDALYAGRNTRRLVKMNLHGEELKSYLLSAEVTAGPVMGPGGQIVIGTQDGILYSFTTDLDLRWVQFTGAAVLGAPAFTSDALCIVNQGGVHAYHPHSGEPLWSRPIAETVTGGSVAVGPNRHLVAYTNQGQLRAYGEGWMYPPQAVVAMPIGDMTAGPAVNVTWDLPGSVTAREAFAAQADSVVHSTNYTPTGMILQRSEDGGPWQSIVILPPNTTSYSDTAVTRNTVYAYRVQVVEAEGADSDFTFTAAPVRSLPDLPTAPTLLSAQAVSAEAISLTWQLPVDKVVTGVRLERATTLAGPFAPVQTFSADFTSTIDDALAPETGYVYRLIAQNQSGESEPSNVLSKTTFAQSLTAPQDVTIQEQENGDLVFVWSGAAPGALVAIEYAQGTFAGYIPLTTVSAEPSFVYSPNFEEPVNTYRLKFVQGEQESLFVTVQVTRYEAPTDPTEEDRMYLPIIVR